MRYNLEWKVNDLRALLFTPSNDRIISRQSWILDSRYWIRNSLSEKLGFWIPIFSGIQVSLSWIQGSKAQDSGFRKQTFQDSGFHKQKFPLFQNPASPTLGDTYVHGLGIDGVEQVIVNRGISVWEDTLSFGRRVFIKSFLSQWLTDHLIDFIFSCSKVDSRASARTFNWC